MQKNCYKHIDYWYPILYNRFKYIKKEKNMKKDNCVKINFEEGSFYVPYEVFKNNVGEILEGPYDFIKNKYAIEEVKK